ncbi:ATP-binding protein [Oceanidesulfovibrio marinus]|uniref:Uncharacterized protein n=1 Tax=Oceanidesulfovibrio marinus TaxID=370038 RepID=A0A6P1ZC89_9BACT|nr:ATP-binding protein [Oceanidesulfovibrio marinus]TVM30604.1 hypothetical protein DQK91_20435 [Oceanidesulfovibrio marinus]
MPKAPDTVTLELPAHVRWLPAAQAVVEHGAPTLGLPPKKVMRLVMAVEEIFVHLARTTPGCAVLLRLLRRGSSVQAVFRFQADVEDLWAMNLTAAQELTPTDENMDHMGLLLAAGVSDGFSITREGGTVQLVLSQDKVYPETTPSDRGLTAARGALRMVDDPHPAEVAEACALARGLYPAEKLHPDLSMAGKLVDNAAGGGIVLSVAKDDAGAILGMMFWEQTSERSVGFCGPYVFSQNSGPVAKALTENMLNCLARSRTIGVCSRRATDDLPLEGFEALARIHYCHKNIVCAEQRIWFRLLREDDGAVIWAHAGMVDFLEETYARLSLMRDIRTVENIGIEMPARSVFAAELNQELSEAHLRVLIPGLDVEENIRKHAAHLRSSGYENIFFTLDLALGEQACLGGALMANGFEPALVLPFAGKSDLVVFQHVASRS